MSWDLVVFDLEDPPSDPEDGTAIFPDGWQPPEIGSGHSIRAKIRGALPTVNWSDPEWGCVESSDFSSEFNMGREDIISSFMIHARGNATPAIVAVISFTGWRILDTSTGKWMHKTSNPDEGRKKFQAYLDKVLETQNSTKKPNLLKRIFRW